MTAITGNSRHLRWLVAPAAVIVTGAVWFAATSVAGVAAEPAGDTLLNCTPPPPPPPTAAAPSASASPTAEPVPPGPVTVETLEEAYNCVLTYYYNGPKLDHRRLLIALFAATTEELNRRGTDVAGATMPALTGDKAQDWATLEDAYRGIMAKLPDDAVRQAVTEVALNAMIDSLGDNHAHWDSLYQVPPPGYEPGDVYDFGFDTNLTPLQLKYSAGTAVGPLFVTLVRGGPAKAAGIRPGDVIEAIDGAKPFIDGEVTDNAVRQLSPVYPQAHPVRLDLLRPATGRELTVTLKPESYAPDAGTMEMVNPKLLPGNVAYVWLRMFGRDAADQTLAAIEKLRAGGRLTGVVLDLRANHGGAAFEVDRLLAAFTHGKITAYQCTVDGACLENHTDDSVALLNLPLTVLTDRGCDSACDHFAAAVKDYAVAPIIGTRSGGQISGEGAPFWLSNHTLLVMPIRFHLGPKREYVNGIGVAPDYHVPLTAEDVSKGRDPAIETALKLLRN